MNDCLRAIACGIKSSATGRFRASDINPARTTSLCAVLWQARQERRDVQRELKAATREIRKDNFFIERNAMNEKQKQTAFVKQEGKKVISFLQVALHCVLCHKSRHSLWRGSWLPFLWTRLDETTLHTLVSLRAHTLRSCVRFMSQGVLES